MHAFRSSTVVVLYICIIGGPKLLPIRKKLFPTEILPSIGSPLGNILKEMATYSRKKGIFHSLFLLKEWPLTGTITKESNLGHR
jgi:hypothetical protein